MYREVVKARPVIKTFQPREFKPTAEARILNKSLGFDEKSKEKPRFLSEESQELADKRRKRGEFLSKRLERMRREREENELRRGLEDRKVQESIRERNSELLRKRSQKSLLSKEKVKAFQEARQSKRQLIEEQSNAAKRKVLQSSKMTEFQRQELEKLVCQ